jgi:hypothetical protein
LGARRHQWLKVMERRESRWQRFQLRYAPKTAPFAVALQAHDIQRALEIVAVRYPMAPTKRER